jgi:hypothetical protein
MQPLDRRITQRVDREVDTHGRASSVSRVSACDR